MGAIPLEVLIDTLVFELGRLNPPLAIYSRRRPRKPQRLCELPWPQRIAKMRAIQGRIIYGRHNPRFPQ